MGDVGVAVTRPSIGAARSLATKPHRQFKDMPTEDPASARFQEVFDDGKICRGGVAMEEVFLKGFTDGFTKEAAKKEKGGIAALKAKLAPAKKEEKAEKKGGMASLKAKLFKGAEAEAPAETETKDPSFKDYLREKYLGKEAAKKEPAAGLKPTSKLRAMFAGKAQKS